MAKEKRKVVDVFIKHGRAFSIGWEIENCGFGEFRFWHENDDLIIMDDEHMKKETVKAVLCALVDKAMPLRERAVLLIASVTDNLGHRIYPDKEGNLLLKEGDYGYHPRLDCWMGRPPGQNAGSFCKHTVTEHKDGTITVSPSILLQETNEAGELIIVWHGYLGSGEWKEISE